MAPTKKAVETFVKKAELVSAVVTEVKSLKEAIEYTVDICDKKEKCQLLASGCELDLSNNGQELCELKTEKVIAAPALKKADLKTLTTLSEKQGFEVITDGLRQHLAGIDIAFTYADLGIAETGTLVLNSSSEELRLSTMIAETHVAVLPKSKLRETSYDAEEEILAYMKESPNYLAFITGASRTADIERVLAIGVHGPLELHILLLEDK